MNLRITLLLAAAVLALPAPLYAQSLPGAVPGPTAQGLRAHVTRDHLIVRQGPGIRYRRLTLLRLGAPVTLLERQGSWGQVHMADGRTGWLLHQFLQYETGAPSQPAATAAGATQPPPAAAAPSSTAPATGNAPPPAPSQPGAQAGGPLPRPAKSSSPPAKPAPRVPDLLAGTRPDPAERTQDSPAGTVGDAWKLLLYLLPVLALIVLAVRGLKAFYQRTGSLPTARQSLLGGLNLANARKAGGSSIRLLESLPVGGAGLHLVEVKGRVLLLGTTATTISRLAEFTDGEAAQQQEFQAILQEASAGMETDDDPLSSVVGTLDQTLRRTREDIARRAAIRRPWREGEGHE